jgi:hypothetical protein
MTDLATVAELATADHNLAVLAVARPDGTVQASVVSAGVIADPVDGSPGVGLVANGGTRKLSLLRADPRATVVVKAGFRWAALSGPVRLIGPDDRAHPDIDVPALIRSVYVAAGGTHEDWEEFDRVMAADRRCAVFVRGEHVWSNA